MAKNKYLIASPAPTLASKSPILRIMRPKLYLQLQQLSADQRPRPVLDALSPPRSWVNICPDWMKRHFWGVSSGRHDATDVLLTESGGYDADVNDEKKDLTTPKVIALLRLRTGGRRSGIILGNTEEWIAHDLPNGSYEFVRVGPDGDTAIARWALKTVSTEGAQAHLHSSRSARRASSVVEISTSSNLHPCFVFSIISPKSWRHAILAALERDRLEINETYIPMHLSDGGDSGYDFSTSSSACPGLGEIDDREGIVGEATKKLTMATAIWVTLRVGWSPVYRSPIQAVGKGS
ncbi:hypothetical protein QBC33DRAFT_246591 [Phialemonium atrogriseum]|uniref:Uncharacterized protein n=1 Tax=Phialemonium atrogriseum TaxID=1093897 RepID=A0AAJ0BUG7_9PEZI|nr:uncharacterized protein QBC33DRAFT_246591 [Phialemonium atrogriseum]KAK1763339.1 hypothetical protein QBC33DRAFT_246591 [Phialemonium atrogriseum]